MLFYTITASISVLHMVRVTTILDSCVMLVLRLMATYLVWRIIKQFLID